MLLPALKRQGNRLLALTVRPRSTLAQAADVHLDVRRANEACRCTWRPREHHRDHGDGRCLAVACWKRGFTRRRLAARTGVRWAAPAVHIADVMHTGDDVPRCRAAPRSATRCWR